MGAVTSVTLSSAEAAAGASVAGAVGAGAAGSITATGAAAVTAEYDRLLETGQYRNLIASACPSIVRLIQIYYPEALPYLAQVDSPMVAHAKILKSECPDAKVVFIGPCIAKKRESDESVGRTGFYGLCMIIQYSPTRGLRMGVKEGSTM